jgi:hypothetical protein
LRDYEPGEVGDVHGKTLLHLQCHLGLDTLSWARVVASLVAPGGFCYLTEGHPFIHFVEDDGRTLRGDYFSRDAILLDEGTYGNPDAELESSASVEWVHHTANVVSALGAAGLRVEFLHEHDWIWYRLLPVLEQHDDGHWRFPEGGPRIPLLYSLRAVNDR